MKHFSFLLPLLLLGLLINSCSSKIGDPVLSNIDENDSDSVIIQPEKALFIFKIKNRDIWKWYQEDTAVGQAEYGWWAEFEAGNKHYTSGYRLFKHPFGKPAEGSFQQLLEAGQVDLAYRTKTTTKETGSNEVKVNIRNERMNAAHVEPIVYSNYMIIILEEKEVINQLHDTRPDSIMLHKQTAVREFERSKVKVSYSLK